MTSTTRIVRILLDEFRSIPVILGLGAFLIANRAWVVAYASVPSPFFDTLFTVWLAAAGVACIVFAVKFTSRWWMAISGALLITGLLSRACAVVFRMAESAEALESPQLHIAGVTYTLLAFTCLVVWARVLAPAVTLRRRIDGIGS